MSPLVKPASFPSVGLQRLAAQLYPGATVSRVRRLGGGNVTTMHAVDLMVRTGSRHQLVVRRYHHDWPAPYTEMPVRGWRTLQFLEAVGIPAPRPVLFDPDGRFFTVPAVVMTRLPGRPSLRPRNLALWCRDFGATLASFHRAPLDGFDLSFLPGPGATIDSLFERVHAPPEKLTAHPDGPQVLDALRTWRPLVDTSPTCFCHGDYWSGNTLWHRNRLSGVVDWDWSRVEHPGVDLGYARMELALLHGDMAPEHFLRAYEEAGGRTLPHVFFWDLLGALQMIEIPAQRWLARYHDIEPTGLNADELDRRLRAFIADALSRAGG